MFFQVVLFIICISAFPLQGAPAQNSTQPLTGNTEGITAFVGVNVIPMDSERILEAQTVIVRRGVISEIGPATTVKIPDAALRVEARGKYLLPGLTDFHIHLRSPDELLSYLSYGVTTVVLLSGATSGAPDLLRYRDELAEGRLIGPQLFTTGPILDGSPPIFPGVSVTVETPEEARTIVLQQKRAGYNFIKVYNNIMPDVLSAIITEAHKQSMAVVGHIPRKAGREKALQQTLMAGVDIIAHGEEYFFTFFYGSVDSLLDLGQVPHVDEKRIPTAVRLSKEAGVTVIPNLSFVAMTRKQLDDLHGVLTDQETRYLHPDVLAMWKSQNPARRPDLTRFDLREKAKFIFLKKLTKALNEAGVPLLLGTDASAPGLFPGKSAHTELQELESAGLSPFDALAAGTRNAGKFINEHVSSSRPFGTVSPGHEANLILLDENPLLNIWNMSTLQGVMVGGKWHTQEELIKKREELAGSYSKP